MKKLILLAALFATQVFAGEAVIVTWTPPSDINSGLPYSGYRIYYTDSQGNGFQVDVPDPAATTHTVPDVEFGPSTWVMTSLCANCQVTESDPSAQVAFTVKYKGVPSAPNAISISLGN